MADNKDTGIVTANDVRTPNPSNTLNMAGDPKDAAEGKPTAGLSTDAPGAVAVTAPVVDPPPGTVKANQPGKDASGNAHQMDQFAVHGWVDHPEVAVDGTIFNAHSPGPVIRRNPLKHQGEDVPKGDPAANPLNYAAMHPTTPTKTATVAPFDDTVRVNDNVVGKAPAPHTATNPTGSPTVAAAQAPAAPADKK